MMLQSAVLLWAITLVALPYRFSFLLHILKIHICFSRLGHCLGTLCWHSDWLPPKTISYCQISHGMSDLVSSVLLSTSYLHFLIVSRSLLLLILIILIRLCAYFLLRWSVLQFLTFYLLMLLFSLSLIISWVGSKNSLIRETPNSYLIVLLPMYPIFPSSLPNMAYT